MRARRGSLARQIDEQDPCLIERRSPPVGLVWRERRPTALWATQRAVLRICSLLASGCCPPDRGSASDAHVVRRIAELESLRFPKSRCADHRKNDTGLFKGSLTYPEQR
jgi:hypothetical protein